MILEKMLEVSGVMKRLQELIKIHLKCIIRLDVLLITSNFTSSKW